MMNKRLTILLILLIPIAFCGIAWYFWLSPVTTVVIVRHAERLNDSDTTSISETGKRRAGDLANVLAASGLQRIYVSEKSRTRQTAEPAAQRLGLTISEIPAKQIAVFADSVKAHRGDVILIVGHSDTVPRIIAKLGVPNIPPMHSSEFDNMYVLTMYRYRTTLVRLKFGSPS